MPRLKGGASCESLQMKKERAYVDRRRSDILEALHLKPKMSVEELALRFNVSLITIRRDLQYLEDQGLLIRFYGGAKIKDGYEKNDKISIYKDMIARFAASLVEDDDIVFINTSSTALGLIPYISKKNVSIITNNGRAIDINIPDSVSVILTGGELRHPKNAMVGDLALRNLQDTFPKRAFIGCSGLSLEGGMMTENANEVNINQLMISQASQTFLMADHTKIGYKSNFVTCPLDRIQHLITDEEAPMDVLNEMKSRGVDVTLVGAGGIKRL